VGADGCGHGHDGLSPAMYRDSARPTAGSTSLSLHGLRSSDFLCADVVHEAPPLPEPPRWGLVGRYLTYHIDMYMTCQAHWCTVARMTSQWLEGTEDRAWRSYRRMVTLLESRLARDLAEHSDLSMADYTVLSNLVEVEGRRWRITALAERMQWSQSRLSHQIRRMEERGLVTREQVADDGRGAVVVLTRQGLRAIAAATPGHLASVRKHMIDLLNPDQLTALAALAETVVDHLADDAETA
jgi:DNA-binding MarR family transcriptional regulator